MSIMRRPQPTSRPAPGGFPALASLVAAATLVLPAAAAAAPGALLEVYFGPSETSWLAVDGLSVLLDGQEIPMLRPEPDDPPGKPLFSGPIGPGPHRLEMTASLRGDSDLFTYVDEYRFIMRGRLDLAAPAGHVVGVHGRVQASSGATIRWVDRYRLALATASYPSDRAAALEAVASPPPPALPAPAPVETGQASGTSAPPPAAACVLGTVRFGFDRSALTPAARQAVDRFAACLAAGSGTIELAGHCDVRGSDAYNQALGQRRADAVASRLEAGGVAAGRVSTRSFGESRPVCREAAEACHARNRRVEAVVGE